eukprot:NODE_933_length_2957_cov_0.476907.p1 type:complete len:421 gc:universal NODE_933_length_2957_cov_0.476907:180-1442(+)
MELELSELKTQLENVELTEKQKSKLQKKYDKVKSKHERQLELKRQQDLAEENDESKGKYGELPLNQSQQKTNTVYASFTKLSDFLDKDVVVIGRVHAIRGKGKMVFVVIRQGYETLQCIIQQSEGFSKLMLKFIQQQQPESMVKIKGVVKTAEVSGCTLKSLELQIHEFFVFAKLKRDLPFTIEQAMVNENDEETLHSKVHLDTKLNNRVLDLRTITNHAIFKIQSQMCLYFRQYLQGLGFIEIHTPKLNGSASEGGASVFKVQYFNRNAYLAQSPQLYKQMLICSDFNRVFEIGPVFRSEDSNTHRHMTEFMGLDLEMAFNEHYDEVIQVIGDVLIHIFDELKSKCGRELEIINKQHPFTPLKYKHKGELLRLTFAEGIKMLQESGVDIQENQDIKYLFANIVQQMRSCWVSWFCKSMM